MGYHMRRKDREIVDEERVRGILARGRFATFALCDGEEPYAVTLSYGYVPTESRLYFHVAHQGMKLDVIRRNARACGTVVVAADYQQGECAHPYESVVMRGRMRLLDREEEKRHALRTLVEHLEDDPDAYWSGRDLDDAKRLDSFTGLCFEIEHMSAKEGS